MALNVNDTLRNRTFAQRGQGTIGEMCSKYSVVLIDCCAQQRRTPAGDAQLKTRQHTCVIGKQAVVAALNIAERIGQDRKSTRLNSSHANISYAVFCLKKKKQT